MPLTELVIVLGLSLLIPVSMLCSIVLWMSRWGRQRRKAHQLRPSRLPS